ncbi:MAG: cytochrome c oxidase subunit II, partial [Opitutales bacterium]
MTRLRFDRRLALRSSCTLLGGLLLAFLTGCAWANLNGPQSTMHVAGPVARAQLDLFMVTVWVTAVIFVIVGAVLAYATLRFKARSQTEERAVPPDPGHGNPLVEVALISASVALLVIIAIPTLKNIWYTHDVPEADRANAIDINATGYQWWFKFEYPGEMVKLPAGGEVPLATGNELVIPAGTPVRIHLLTVDVIHSFWVPKLAGKVDMIPNRANFLWLQADQPGYFYGQCAEYCGDSHAIMRFRVVALSPSEYVRWVENQKAAARTVTAAAQADRPHVPLVSLPLAQIGGPATGPGSTLSASADFDADPLAGWKQKQQPAAGENPALIARGRQLFADKTCISCHTIRGHEGIGITGPELT